MTQRTALVTGGTGGIGSAIIRYLASEGHRVVTNYRDEAKAEAWRQALASEGIQVCMVQGDVCEPVACEAMMSEIVFRRSLPTSGRNSRPAAARKSTVTASATV